MKILVTGATGFIGNYVVQELLKRNLNVIASGTSLEKADKFDWFSKVEFIPYTIGQKDIEENVFEKFKRPDILIHLAWKGLPNYTQLFHFEEVLPAQYLFLKQLISEGLSNISITGTCFEYGMQEGCLSEDMPSLPGNSYALAKNTLRCFLEEFRKHSNFDFKWIRLFYMFGKGQSQNSILSQLDRALADNEPSFNMSKGDQLRDYLPVEKVAEYIVDISLQNVVTGIINCCSGKPISIKTLVENHLEQKQKTIHLNLGYYPYPDYEPRNFWGDNNKLKQISHV